MKARGAVSAVAMFSVAVTLGLPKVASASHAPRISDYSNPDATAYNGQICSVDAVTPSGSYSLYDASDGSYYRLRYSANCRSIWGRSANNASKRNGMHTHRHDVYGWTSGIYTGATYAWTAQLDDLGHQGNLHVDNLGETASY